MNEKEGLGLNLDRYVHSTEEVNEVGEQFIQFFSSIADFFERHFPSWLPKGLHASEVLSSVLSFAVIPMIYLSSYLSNEKVPFNLKNNARWLYSGVLLGLTIAAVVVPGVAPILAIVAAGLSLSVAGFILAKALHKMFQRVQERDALRAQLPSLAKEHALLEDKIHALEAQLSLAPAEKIDVLKKELDELTKRLHANEFAVVQEKEAELHLKIKGKGLTKIADKSIGVLFASLAAVGFTLSLVLPPVGFIVLTSTFALSLTYMLGRLAYSAIEHLRSKEEASMNEHQEAPVNLDYVPKESLNHSTIDMINALNAHVSVHLTAEKKVDCPSKTSGNSIFSHEVDVKNQEEEEHPHSLPH